MVALNSKFDILRGWPNSSAIAEDLSVSAASTRVDSALKPDFAQGTWCRLDTTNGYTAKDEGLGDVDSAVGFHMALIIEGTDDYSAQFVGKVTVLLGGGYVYRVGAAGVKTNAVPTVGASVKVVDGLIALDGAPAYGVTVGTCLAADVNAGTYDIFIN